MSHSLPCCSSNETEQIFEKEAFCKVYLRISVQSSPPAQRAALEIEMLPRSFRGVWPVARSQKAHMLYFLKKALVGSPKLISSFICWEVIKTTIKSPHRGAGMWHSSKDFQFWNGEFFLSIHFLLLPDKQVLFFFLSVITVQCESSDIVIVACGIKYSFSCMNMFLKSPAGFMSSREHAESSLSLSTKFYSESLNFVSSTGSHLL